MKKFCLVLLAPVFVMACHKDEKGKHCPLMTETRTGHLVDLTPVAWLPQIMDTLAKYPQLQVRHVNFRWGHDPGSYSANIHCNVYHKGLLVLNEGYYLYASSYGSDTAFNKSKIPLITTSSDPALTLEKANAIAAKTVDFEYCTVSSLAFSNKGTVANPDYKLVWRIRGADNGYPIVELDAQSGAVLYSYDGRRYNGTLID